MDLTPEQVNQLQSLGITISKSTQSTTKDIGSDHKLAPSTGSSQKQPIVSSRVIPLLSISGLTLISFGSLVLFKSKTTTLTPPVLSTPLPVSEPTPTQVPKSIQHYLLASQQYFTQALSAQSKQNSAELIGLVNQALVASTEAIKQFPNDYRGYEQRGRIYQSLIDSQPQTIPLAIGDLTQASHLNPTSAEITRTLANLFARQGNAQSTIDYLARTVSLEPTKAQNFYDLAKIQQQIGQLPAALDTYNRLITIISDPIQRTQIESEKSAIEHLLSQNKTSTGNLNLPTTSPNPIIPPQTEGPLLQANAGTGLIIAAPETTSNISVSNLVDSNSLSGTATLPAGQKSISLTNHQLKPTSQVYLTVVRGGKNLSLQVLSKSVDSFTVGLDTPTTEPIDFKWWLINP